MGILNWNPIPVCVQETPCAGTTGTIAVSIKGGLAATAGFVGLWPIQWVTLGTPTGETERPLRFVLDPSNTFNFAQVANEISIYSV